MGVDMHAVGVRAAAALPILGPWQWGDPWRFSVNWRGMSELIVEMDTVGLIDEDTPEPEWPKWPGDEHLQERYEPSDLGEDWEGVTDLGCEWCDLNRAIRYTLGEHGKVPVFKFGTNDGWVITPVECIWIADALDERVALLEGRWQQLVNEFVAFNRRCAEGAGGYAVR